MNRGGWTLILVALLILGCNVEEPADDEKAVQDIPTTATAPASSGDNITPYTPSSAAIPNAPVAGAENVGSGSGGFGVGQAAKNQARGVAGSAGSSLDQMGGE